MTPFFFLNFFFITVTFWGHKVGHWTLMTLWPFGVINYVMIPFFLSSFHESIFFSYNKTFRQSIRF